MLVFGQEVVHATNSSIYQGSAGPLQRLLHLAVSAMPAHQRVGRDRAGGSRPPWDGSPAYTRFAPLQHECRGPLDRLPLPGGDSRGGMRNARYQGLSGRIRVRSGQPRNHVLGIPQPAAAPHLAWRLFYFCADVYLHCEYIQNTLIEMVADEFVENFADIVGHHYRNLLSCIFYAVDSSHNYFIYCTHTLYRGRLVQAVDFSSITNSTGPASCGSLFMDSSTLSSTKLQGVTACLTS